MKTRGWLVGVIAASATLGQISTTTWAADGDKDCRYVVGTAAGLAARDAYDNWFKDPNHDPKKRPPVLGGLIKATVRYVQVPDCQPQCMGRIFCFSDHKKELAGLDLTDTQKMDAKMTELGVDVTCDANPGSTPLAPSCKPANECMAQARANKKHVAVPTDYAAGPATYQNDPDEPASNVTVHYGADRLNPEKQIPMFTVPSDPQGSHPKQACHICASPTTVGAVGFSFVACNALNDGAGGCPGLPACLTEADSDPASYSVRPISGAQLNHVSITPTSGGSHSSAGGASVPSKNNKDDQ